MARSRKNLNVRKLLSLAALVASMFGSSSLMAAPQVPTPEELFDWAQVTLPDAFPGTMSTQSGDGFAFRGPYASRNFAGVMGSKVYVLGPVTGDVLLAVGEISDFSCSVHPNSCQSSDALDVAKTFLRSVDALYQSTVTTGQQAVSRDDGCFLRDGRTKADESALFDADPERRALVNQQRGTLRSEVEVVAERNTTNQDGSARREIDVRYTRTYADGVVEKGVTGTLIQGSSSGSVMATGLCTTPQSSQEVRWFGNRRIVGVSVNSLSMVYERFKLSDGAPLSSQPRYRSEVRFNVRDPSNHATYATIAGPGIRGTYKLISPRLLRSAPEFMGKIGNFVDWQDDDTFKACREATGNNYAEAIAANCTVNGAETNIWQATGTDPVQVDQQFVTYGFVENGTYTINVYNDDGWKTVNGQAGKTPVATYTVPLNRLPSNAADLAQGGASAFPEATFSMTPAQMALLARSGSAGALQATVTRRASANGVPLGWSSLYYFVKGVTAASTQANFYPASRLNREFFPAVDVNSHSTFIPAAPVAMTKNTYGEFGVVQGDRNGYSVRRIRTFE